VVEVVSGGFFGIVKMGTFPENLIFNMDETAFSVSGCHPLCLCLVQALEKCVGIHSH